MKREKGITLVTLIITVVLILILAGVAISSGGNTIDNSKLIQFNTEMQIIQSRVNELIEGDSIENLNTLGQSIPSSKSSQAITASGISSLTEYRYFNKDGLESIDIYNIDREIIINFSTRDVVDINGVEVDGTKVYRLNEWTNVVYAPGYEEYQEVEYIEGTGTQWIDTGVVANNNSLSFEVKYKWVELPNDGVYRNVFAEEYVSESANTTRIIQYGKSITYLNVNSKTGSPTKYSATRNTNTIYTDKLSRSTYVTNGVSKSITITNGSANSGNILIFGKFDIILP